jgi:hypothetical protein
MALIDDGKREEKLTLFTMTNLKNPGRRNIRFLLQILAILLLVMAAAVARAEEIPNSVDTISTTL